MGDSSVRVWRVAIDDYLSEAIKRSGEKTKKIAELERLLNVNKTGPIVGRDGKKCTRMDHFLDWTAGERERVISAPRRLTDYISL